VDRGTQWSPTTPKMSAPPPEPILQPRKSVSTGSPVPTAGTSTISNPFSMPMSADQTKSPGMKRRKSEDGISSTVTTRQTTTQKRPKSTPVPIKVLPAKYELCEVEDVVVLIANMISELIQTNDELPLRSGVLTRFHSRTPPGISVLDYLQRLAKHATLTPPLLLSMVYYIDRLCSLYPAFTITTLTVHRFLITAATVAAKGLSDSFWNNALYARVGGVKLAELGLLELEFLYRVDWKIVPNPEVLVDYYRGLVERADNYVLESDGKSADEDEGNEEEEEEEEEDGEEESKHAEPQAEAGTDVQWKAWMDDVSSRKARK